VDFRQAVFVGSTNASLAFKIRAMKNGKKNSKNSNFLEFLSTKKEEIFLKISSLN
jgi:hypothetical protein